MKMASKTSAQMVYGEETLENSIIACVRCNSEAQIYNDIGDFCLNCWQSVTHSNV